MVMPLLPGGDLRKFLRAFGPMEPTKARYYAAQVILAMDELHRAAFIYRDLKPENCLLDERGQLVLADFGLVQALDPHKNFHTTGAVGTRGYEAPEVVANKSYSFAADFWSYGIMLFELVTGRVCESRFGAIMAIAGRSGAGSHSGTSVN